MIVENKSANDVLGNELVIGDIIAAAPNKSGYDNNTLLLGFVGGITKRNILFCKFNQFEEFDGVPTHTIRNLPENIMFNGERYVYKTDDSCAAAGETVWTNTRSESLVIKIQ